MICLMYVSFARTGVTVPDVKDLVGRSARENARFGITGVLLYHDGLFMQVLEGPEADVDRLMANIRKDHRHHSVNVLYRHGIARRYFATWSMGYADFQALPEHERHYCTSLCSATELEKSDDVSNEIGRLFSVFHEAISTTAEELAAR